MSKKDFLGYAKFKYLYPKILFTQGLKFLFELI